MNLVSFSIKTKGVHNFARRLWTVFTRFGFSEGRVRKSLHALVDSLQRYNSAPTFFIPAVVLRRHSKLIKGIAGSGAEIGIHGYVHNDYRSLNKDEQYQQTQQAMSVFQDIQLPYQGFRNPYLGWTEESLDVFSTLGFTYESNEAIIHNVIDLNRFSLALRNGYEKSLALFQAIPCNVSTLRPHFEGTLLRIPTSIPDDEMLFDRLRITDPEEIGHIWSKVMQRVYDFGGLYALNLHPERGILCKQALDILLSFAYSLPRPVWLARLEDIAMWWKERSQFRLRIMPLEPGYWSVEADCTPRATLFARQLTVDYKNATARSDAEDHICSHRCIVQSTQCPCIGLSLETPQQVMDFLYEQGYPVVRCSNEDAQKYALYLDMPEGLGITREEQRYRRSIVQVLLAEYQGIVIASMILFASGTTIRYAYGASDERYLHLAPNNLLLWTAITWASTNGYQTLDLGRTACENEGLMEFKRRWGAIKEPLPYYYYPQTAGLASTSERSWKYRLLTSCWRKLPVGVAGPLGSLLYKHLG